MPFEWGRFTDAAQSVLSGRNTQGIDYYVGTSDTKYKVSDNNSGLTPFEPLATMTAALGKCTTGLGDRIIILPGTVTLAAALAVNKDDISILGSRGRGQGCGSKITIGASPTEMFEISASNIEIAYLELASLTACTRTIGLADAANTTGFWMHHCIVNDSASHANNVGLQLGDVTGTDTIATDVLVEDCVWFGETSCITVERCNRGIIRRNQLFMSADGKQAIEFSDVAGACTDQMNIVDNYIHGYNGNEVGITINGADGEQVGCGIGNNIFLDCVAGAITTDLGAIFVAWNFNYDAAGGALVDVVA